MNLKNLWQANNPARIARAARAVLALLILAAMVLACSRATPTPTATPTPSETASRTVQPTDTLESDAPVQRETRTPSNLPSEEEEPTQELIEVEPTIEDTPEDTPTPKPEYIFEVDEFGYPLYPVDENGVQFFPLDRNGNPIIATDEIGYPVFPYDDEGMPIIPTDRAGKPMFDVDEFGNPIVPEPTFVDEEFLEEDVDADPTETIRPGSVRITATPRTGSQRTQPGDSQDGDQRSLSGATGTPIVWATPASTRPLGDPANPLVMAVLSAPGDEVALDAMTALADRIASDTGLSITVQPVSSAAQLLNGMRANAIHLAWLQPFTYIIAEQRGYAEVALVTNHFGVTAYGSMFLAADLSGFETYFDPAINKTTASAEEALAQFEGLKPCYVDPLSASGYIVPEGLLRQYNISRQSPVFLNSHTAVVRALYVTGICDYGVTFGISGDPRTASTILSDLSDTMERVPVIWRTDAIIPNLNLSIHTKVPQQARLDLMDAFVDLVQTDEGKDMLTYATAYDIQGFEKVTDAFYDPLRKLLNLSRVNVRDLVGK